MEEIDNIIIHSLRQIGCDIDENSSLRNLEPELVVKCISKCLRCIDPSLVELPDKMPTGMAQKYGVTLALAEKCTEIGFRGDIGYQTFLYSNNTAELRRVLMFLIDKLPKDETDNVLSTRDLTEEEILDMDMRKSLAISLKLNKRTLPLMGTGKLNFACMPDYDPKRSVYLQTNPSNIWSTLIVNNDGGSSDRDPENFKARPTKSTELLSSATVGSDSMEGVTESGENTQTETPKADPVELKRIENETLFNDLQRKKEERQQLLRRIEEIKRRSTEEKAKIEELKQGKKIKERTLLVLENPQENVQKLQKMIENSAEKMKRLQEQWIEHKMPLQQQIDEINAKKETEASKTKVIEDQILEARQNQEVIRMETSTKARQYAELMEALGKVSQKIDRSDYTNRILEIIGNIRKQKTDIDKILRDTREVQKDINTVTGKLERQFTVTDDLLFSHAKRDEQTKRAYKLFIKAHSDCGELAKSIEDTGKVAREIRDLEEQIESSRTRNTDENLHQVSKDLEEMTEENQKLFQEIQRIRQEKFN